MHFSTLCSAVVALASTAQAFNAAAYVQELKAKGMLEPEMLKRGLPANPTGVKTIKAPSGAAIRYKEPGKAGVCETTPGVNSYSGYVDIDAHTHMFFWFFEARQNASTAPITLWLNGGPGADSLIGLFDENGPCNVTSSLKTQLNPYSWSATSNMLYLSQPVGVGFSYDYEQTGSLDSNYNVDPGSGPGRYADVDPYRVDTTQKAAQGAWDVLQGFLANLPTLDSKVKSRSFNLWTESYGGHYGPVFFDYFQTQNAAISSGSSKGVQLNMNTLGVGNGLFSILIQGPYYPEFAVHNTYGIQAVNQSIYQFMKTAFSIPGGCASWTENCLSSNLSDPDGLAQCSQAGAICTNLVAGPYQLSGRDVYDIRAPAEDPNPPTDFVAYLNQASVQNAIGVNLNYTPIAGATVRGFDFTGDLVYNQSFAALEKLLQKGVRVNMYHGDADYLCNWFGGEAVSLAAQWPGQAAFNAAGYAPFVVNGQEKGAVRQYGNFSFVRIYDAGHEVPFYQPAAAQAMFQRVISGFDVATGKIKVTGSYGTSGNPKATHTEPTTPAPTA